jgi:uncharacterized FAD-dependent dehydrogenase
LKYTVSLTVSPETAASPDALKQAAAKVLLVGAGEIKSIQMLRRSIDARHGHPQYRLEMAIYTDPDTPESPLHSPPVPKHRPARKTSDQPVIIVGAGPAGLFAALRLLEYGLRPLILERGKDVSARKYDIAKLSREHIVHPDSNWCFGEGGAGAFSDGKLYTRSNKRGNITAILQQLVAHGANPDILIDAHAHIGTDKLPAIIANIRKTIEAHGGEYRFNTCVTDLIVKKNTVHGVIDRHGAAHEGSAVILAAGHSARELYELFDRRGWLLEAKPFAMGVRVEHPQDLINEIQYGRRYAESLRLAACCRRNHAAADADPAIRSLLPPATYNLAVQTGERGVFSFCMCPGGIMVPATTERDSVVVNGMSNSQRNSPYANAGIVVQVTEADCCAFAAHGALAGLRLQQQAERAMYAAAHHSQAAPAQRLLDFVNGKPSARLGTTSYLAGVVAAPLHERLPTFIVVRLQQAFRLFDKKMRGYVSDSAMVVAIESRTSSPVRIPRNPATLQHLQLARLYPCGEGAGYAGGITSSAIDGIRCADALGGVLKKIVN